MCVSVCVLCVDTFLLVWKIITLVTFASFWRWEIGSKVKKNPRTLFKNCGNTTEENGEFHGKSVFLW